MKNVLIFFFVISFIAYMLLKFFSIHRSNIHLNVFLNILCSFLHVMLMELEFILMSVLCI